MIKVYLEAYSSTPVHLGSYSQSLVNFWQNIRRHRTPAKRNLPAGATRLGQNIFSIKQQRGEYC